MEVTFILFLCTGILVKVAAALPYGERRRWQDYDEFRGPSFGNILLPSIEDVKEMEENMYPVFVNKEDIPAVLKIIEYVSANGNYKRELRRTRKSRKNRRRLQRSLVDSISDRSEISVFDSQEGNTQEVLLRLMQLYAEELERSGRRTNLPHGLEYLNPNLFQNLQQT